MKEVSHLEKKGNVLEIDENENLGMAEHMMTLSKKPSDLALFTKMDQNASKESNSGQAINDATRKACKEMLGVMGEKASIDSLEHENGTLHSKNGTLHSKINSLHLDNVALRSEVLTLCSESIGICVQNGALHSENGGPCSEKGVLCKENGALCSENGMLHLENSALHSKSDVLHSEIKNLRLENGVLRSQFVDSHKDSPSRKRSHLN